MMNKVKISILVALFGLFLASCDKDDDENIIVPTQLSVTNAQFFPEDVVVHDNSVYVSGFGDGSIQKFDLTQSTASAQQIAASEGSYTSSWGLNVDASKGTLLNIVNAPYFFNGNVSAPSKVNAYQLSDNSKVSSWTLPTGTVGNSIVVANGFYYIGDIGPSTRIIKLNPNDGTTTIKTDAQWSDGFGFGGMVYANSGIYGVHGGKMWYIPVAANGDLGTVSEVTGLSNVFADGMTWAGDNTIYYCENDAQNPANVGVVWKVNLTSNTTATATPASIPNNGSLNNPSGVFYKEINGKNYLFVNESQIFNTPTTPFIVNIHELNDTTPNESISANNVFVLPIRKVKKGQSIDDFKTKRDAYVKLLEQQFGTLYDKEMQPFFDYVTYQPQSILDSIFIGFTSFQDLQTFSEIGAETSNTTQASQFFSTFDFIDFLTLKPNNATETVDLSTLAPLGSGRVWEVAVRDLSQYSNFDATDYKSKRDAYLAVLAAQPGFVREIQWTDVNNPNKVVGMTIYASQQAVIDINSNPDFNAAAQATGFIQNYPPNVFGTINTVLK